jgi:TMEM199 family protein
MALLAMTPAMVAAIRKCEKLAGGELEKLLLPGEPLLAEPGVGNPISHSQLLDVAKVLKKHSAELDGTAHTDDAVSYRLNDLLRGSKVYVAPPKPKPEPVSFCTASF